jgi:hypothetical protein
MNLIRRDAFVEALEEGILWYDAQSEHGSVAAALLAARFASAVDATIAVIVRRPASGGTWIHRPDYRFSQVRRPFNRWLIFYRLPEPTTIELVDILRGERDLPRRVR